MSTQLSRVSPPHARNLAMALALAGLLALVLSAASSTAAPEQAPAEEAAYGLVDTWRDVTGASRVVAGPGQDVHVLASGGSSVWRTARDGTLLGQVPMPGLSEIAVDPAGNLYAIRDLSIVRLDGSGNIMWMDRIQGEYHAIIGERPPYLAALAWNQTAGRVTLLYDKDTTLSRHYSATGSPYDGVTLAFPTHAYWDIAFDAGRGYLLNRAANTIEIYEGNAIVATAALPAPVERIAVGPDGSLFALSDRRWIYRLDPVTHQPVEAWSARDAEPGAVKSTAVDLDVDAEGRVYVADPKRNQVRVYAPQPGEPYGRLPDPPPGPGCQTTPNKWADPTFLHLGERTKVTLTLDGVCQEVAERADIVIVMDRSESMNYEEGRKIAAAKESLLAFLSTMVWDRDQVALVTFASDNTLDVPLTHDRARLESAVRAVTAGGGTDIAGALDRALEALQGPNRRPDAKPIVVLMTDGVAFDTSRLRTVAASDRLRYAEIPISNQLPDPRVTTYTIGFGEDVDPDLLKVVARSPAHYFYAPSPDLLEDVYRAIARQIKASVLLRTVTIVDTVPGNMTYVVNSAVPPAMWDSGARTLTWDFFDVPFDGIEMSYWLEPQQVGEWPTNISAIYDGVDGLDQPQGNPFPIPRVVVVAPTVTPSSPPPTETPTGTPPPTATAPPTPGPTETPRPTETPKLATATHTPPLPETATPDPTPTTPVVTTPSPTPEGYKIYVIIVFNSACFKRYTDVSLVIDASTTMLEPSENGRLKIDEAKDAARAFIDQLQLEPDPKGRHDQASIVWYNDRAGVAQPLTNNRDDLNAAIERIQPVEGSRIDLGLDFGHRELLTEFRPNRRLSNTPAIVLLSDGLPNRVPTPAPIGPQEETVAAAADAAKRDGIAVYTVGYGRNVHEPLLRRVASQPEQYFFAPSGSELDRIYRAIAGDLVCR